MKQLLLAVAVIASFAVVAAADEGKSSSQEKRERRRARMEARIVADGGMVSKANNGNYARIVNCQSKVGTDFIRSVADQFNTGLNVYVEVSEMAPVPDPFELARKALSIPKTGIVAIIVDDDRLPTLLSAMEDGWAILNIRRFRDDLPPKAVYEMRVRKEINRVFAEAAGAGLSFNKPCVMEPVFKVSDLDALTFPVISPEAMSKISQVCKKRGIPARRSDTYRKACVEGWAPAPTNDIQKAIWDKVHAIPDKPITIEFDPRRDK